MLSPIVLKDIQSRSNRSSSQSSLAISTNPENETVGQIISNPVTYEPHSSSQIYNRIYENSRIEFPTIEESKEDKRYQERSNFYDQFNQPYNLFPNTNDPKVIQKSVNADDIRHSSIDNIEQSSSNQNSVYRNAGFNNKPAALAQEPYGGFHDFSPYGHFHGYQPYNNHGNGNRPPANGETATEAANARLENNGTNRQNYGPPPFTNPGYLQPYSPFSYGEYPNYNPYYGPNHKGENDSSTNGANGHPYNSYGPPYGTPNFYGPSDYGYNYGYNNGHNYNGNNNGQPEVAQNGGQSNSSKNGYSHPYGPSLIKPLLGSFHLQGFPSPFNFLPYDHFHGVFKTGTVGVGHLGYPIYVDPYPLGFPFHYPYGTFHHGKNNKYLPPKDSSPMNKDEKAESPAEELAENGEPGRLTALSDKLVAPTQGPVFNSSRLKTSKRKEPKQDSLTNLKNRRV